MFYIYNWHVSEENASWIQLVPQSIGLISVATENKWLSKDSNLGKYLKVSYWIFPLSYITHFIQNFNVHGEKYLDFLHLQSDDVGRVPDSWP